MGSAPRRGTRHALSTTSGLGKPETRAGLGPQPQGQEALQGDGAPVIPASLPLHCLLLQMPPPPSQSSSSRPRRARHPPPCRRHNGQSALPGALCDITQGEPSPRQPVSRCEGNQTHHEQLPPPPLLAMRTLTWFLFLPLCLSCGYAFMFSSVRGNIKEPQGQAPCGGHFRIRQNLPEQAQGWLASKWLWLLFVLILYAVLKFRGGYGEKSKVSVASFFFLFFF